MKLNRLKWMVLDWTNSLDRWGKNSWRIGHDGKQAVSSVECLPYLRYLT